MRMLYLIRHGEPDLPPGRCLARTDAPLGDLGREQAAALGAWAGGRALSAVYTSPALRCRQTAAALGRDALPREDLWELSVGEWENLPFAEIRRRWPAEYEARGVHPGTVAPPGGESFLQAGARLAAALREILGQTAGDVAVVAHAGLFRGWLCGVLGLDADAVLSIRQPRGGVTALRVEGERFTVTGLGLRPALPGPLQCRALFDRCATPAPVIAHGAAVADAAAELAVRMPGVDAALLDAACRLHDLCRAEGRDHPARAAALLDKEGWPALADLVARHHDLGADPPPEAELLYLADRLVAGCERVTLEERFGAARAKCTGPEAVAAWRRRYDDARRLAARCGLTNGGI